MRLIPRVLATLAMAAPACAQTTDDPFPEPIPQADGMIQVDYAEFAVLPEPAIRTGVTAMTAAVLDLIKP